MRHRHRPGPEGSSLALRFDGVNAELFEGATGAGGRLAAVRRAGPSRARRLRRHGRRKGSATDDVRDTIIMVTAGH